MPVYALTVCSYNIQKGDVVNDSPFLYTYVVVKSDIRYLFIDAVASPQSVRIFTY